MKTLLIVSVAAVLIAAAGWKFAGPGHVRGATDLFATANRSGPDMPFARLNPAANVRSLPPPPAARAAQPDPATVAIASAIDVLTSPRSSVAQKRAIWQELRKSGRLDDVIVVLKRLALENPNDAAIAVALGEAEVNQMKVLSESGGSFNELGILAMQADEDFNAALAADPSNWEAQYEKAAALSHWPAALNKRPEVIQQLSNLVSQQEAMTPQPEFAQTYALLGDQYQSAGQAEQARQIWQRGLNLYPLNPTLGRKIAQAPAP